GNMGNPVQDEIAIRANQTRQPHVAIEYPQVISLTNEPLDKLNHRAFTQIIRSCFKAEAQYADPLMTVLRDELHTFCDLQLIAWQYGVHDGQRNVICLRLIRQSSQIFR